MAMSVVYLANNGVYRQKRGFVSTFMPDKVVALR
jgi:hypothetical protein